MTAGTAEQDVSDPLGTLEALTSRRDADNALLVDLLTTIGARRRKGFQAQCLSGSFRAAADLATAVGWHGGVILRDGKVLVELDGVRFDASTDLRFFRKNGAPPGRKMLSVAKRFCGAVDTVFDLGANIGEIAIYCAFHLPQAQVFAFEPAPENLAALRTNLSLQTRALNNLTVVEEAVSGRSGSIAMTQGAGDLNTTVLTGNEDRLRGRGQISIVEVPADTLAGFVGRLQVDRIDFMKVDIEGGEPMLAESIRELSGRLSVCMFEMSRYNTIDAYVDLDASLRAAGMRALSYDLKPLDDFRVELTARLEAGPAINVWYVRQDLLDRSS